MGYFSEMDALLKELQDQLIKIDAELEQPVLPYLRPIAPILDFPKRPRDNKTNGGNNDECPF